MITVGYLSRNRPQHLANSLKTIHEQTVQPSKIVVADCSDDANLMQPIIDGFKGYSNIPIEFVWKPADELSRSQGRQLSREYVDTPLMASIESDCLYPPTLIEETLKAFGNPLKKLYVHPWIAACGPDGKLGPVFEVHRSGFYQCFRIVDFDAIGGFNPFLTDWGYEDADLKDRLLAHGCSLVTLPLIVKHQWHTKVASDNTNARNQKTAKNSYFDPHTKTWKMKS